MLPAPGYRHPASARIDNCCDPLPAACRYTLAQPVFGHHQRHISSSAYKLQPFFRITVVSTYVPNTYAVDEIAWEYLKAHSVDRSRETVTCPPATPSLPILPGNKLSLIASHQNDTLLP